MKGGRGGEEREGEVREKDGREGEGKWRGLPYNGREVKGGEGRGKGRGRVPRLLRFSPDLRVLE